MSDAPLLRGGDVVRVLLSILGASVALAALYERSGSSWPGMVLHGASNAVGITLIYLTI